MSYPTTGTPRVSRYSMVRGRSRIDFAPAQTTATGVRPSSSRSAEMSSVSSTPRWTPPIPPVAKTAMPARCAAIIVAATVVAPSRPVAAAAARSRRLTFMTPDPVASRSTSARSRPTVTVPARTPTNAGSAPRSRTARSRPDATWSDRGDGKPWATAVVSSATTGAPAEMASRTSPAILKPVSIPER